MNTTLTGETQPGKPELPLNVRAFLGDIPPEQPAPSQGLTAEFKAKANIPNGIDFGAALSPEAQLAKLNPYTIANRYSALSDEKGNGSPYEEDTEEGEKESERRLLGRFMQNMTYGGTQFSYKQVTNNLFASLEQTDVFLDTKPTEVKTEDLLFVDKSGLPVDANHPEARLVATKQEQDELAAKNGACSMGLTSEDVTVQPDGTMAKTQDINVRLSLIERKGEVKETLKKLEKGEIAPQDLPEHMKKDIAEMEANGGKLKATSENIPGIVDDIERDIAQKQLAAGVKHPAPAANMTPPPPAFQ